MKTTKHIFLAAALCLCSAFSAKAGYNGTPVTPKQINSSNYTTYGFTSTNYSAYNGWYAISSAAELYGFAELVNGGKKGIKGVLTDDIVVNENVLKADGELNGMPNNIWTPIGTSTIFFGEFDGQGHTISGLFCINSNNVGLFGCTACENYGGIQTISNIGIVDSYFEGSSYVGGICGETKGYTSLTNCYNMGTIKGSNDYVGGICGNANEGSLITNCYNKGKVIGKNRVGGICGYARNNTIITNCYNTGTVKGSGVSVGGICGALDYSFITNCIYLEGCAKDGSNVVQYGLGNSTKGKTTADISWVTLSATAEEFASGKIAYRLNGKTSGGAIWRQNLTGNVDEFPVLDKNHSVVYATQPCVISFANSEMAAENHNYVNGICSKCGEYEKPTLSSGWYLIDNAGKLYWFAEAVNTGNTTISGKLTADIVVNENVLKADGTLNGTPTYSWTPIGTSSKNFEGKFDGQGHTISGLYFSNTTNSDYPLGGNYVGLFGRVKGANIISNKAEISNVGVVDSYIKGCHYIGGICGYASSSTISNCYNTGTVTESSYEVGGICGRNEYSIIINSCNTGTIKGSSYNVGGICGHAYSSTISNCYNIGTITGNSYNVGGICGRNEYSTITNSYYLPGCARDGSNVVQYGTGNGTIGQTTADVSSETASATIEEFASGKIAHLLNGLVSGGTTWHQNLSGEIDAYPVLDNSHGMVFAMCSGGYTNDHNIAGHNFDNGFCTICGEFENPLLVDGWHLIDNAGKLYWFAKFVNSGSTTISGKLTADIVVNENVLKADGTLNGTPTYSWTPIGTSSKNFKGKFDGQGHTISGLYFSNTNSSDYPSGGNYVGLFGYVSGSNCKISNVGVVDPYIKGYQYVGGICGYVGSSSNITNCYNTGTITGSSYYVGGICGYAYSYSTSYSTITNSYNTGTITGSSNYVGGICGYAYSSTISNCYNIGTITGNSYNVGGICGYEYLYSSTTITNCYYLPGCARDGSNVVQYGTGNGTIGQTTADVSGKTTLATTEEFASGKIAYLLNKNNPSGEVWYQTLFSDVTPVLDNTHNSVTGYIDEADNVITVYGDVTIASDHEIAEGKTFVVPEGTSVTIAEGAELVNNGVITVNGTLVINGTITGNSIEGSGDFAYTNLSDSDIETAANGYTYKGTAYTLENGLSDIVVKARTICGKQFTFDATGYTVSYENNLNVGNNAKIIWSGSSTVEKTFAIIPNTNVVVTITGSSNTATYNTEEQSISGYTVDIEDETGVYTENDFTFNGSAAASGTTVGTYAMGLSADAFSNTNDNFAEVQFVVTDGVLTINKADNAPDMPTTIETYYINTNRVALPDNWQWTEDVDLEMGENTATAEYVGEDADNYENVSVEVVVTRTACPHDEGYTTINTAEPTCTEEGYTGDHLCNICNEIFEQGESIDANGHTYSNTVTAPTCTAVGYTTHTCTICEYAYNSDTVAAKGHKADSVEFENIKPATCAIAGSRDSVVYCSVCQAEVSRTKEEVAKLPHTEVTDAAIAATCTAAGKTEGKHCSVCEAVLVAQEEVAALGHEFKDYVYNNDATTTADGTETATCSRCGEKDTRTATGTKLPEPEKGTAVAESATNAVNIYAHHNIIVVENATEEICVYNAMGTLVCRDATPCVRTEINITAPGVYIVKTGSVVKRVMVN